MVTGTIHRTWVTGNSAYLYSFDINGVISDCYYVSVQDARKACAERLKIYPRNVMIHKWDDEHREWCVANKGRIISKPDCDCSPSEAFAGHVRTCSKGYKK